MPEIISRSRAKAAGLQLYFTGKPCVHGHISMRLTIRGVCVECTRKHYQDNKQKYLEDSKRRYAKNREKISEQKKKYREENYDKISETHRRYYEQHTEKIKDRIQTRRKSYPWLPPLHRAKHRAKSHSLSYDLTEEWAKTRWTGSCDLTKFPFDMNNKRHGPHSPSIDRIDPSKGYTQDNCRFILYSVNAFKGVMTDEDMLKIARALIS